MDTLSPFYWEKMIGSVSSRFKDLVTIGQRLEEGIKRGKVFVAGESSSGAKKSFGNFHKKKDGETNVVSIERRRPRRRPQYYDQPQVDAITPAVKVQPIQIPQRQAV